MTVATDNPTEEKVNVGSDSKKFDFNACTKEELIEKVPQWYDGKDPKNRDAFLTLADNDPVAFERIDKMLHEDSSGEEPPKEEPKSDEKSEPSEENADSEASKEDADDFIEIQSLKLRRNQLGTFLKNRSPEEALLLKLDAHDHAERTIVDLKERNNGLSSQTMKLREQLIESRKQPSKTEQKEEIEPDDFDFDRDEADLYDPDQQEKFLSNYEKMLKRLTEGKTQPDVKSDQKGETLNPDEQELYKQLEKNSIQREFDEINDLQRSVPELQFSDGSTFQQKDRQLLEFRQKVANVLGVTSNINAHEQYNSNPKIRQLCEARGITEPPELDKWAEIVKVRQQRNHNLNNYAQQIGKKSIEIPNFIGNTYLDIYNKMVPVGGYDKGKLTAQIKQHEDAARKKDANESRYVTEPPPQVSNTGNSELGQMNEADLNNLIARYGQKGINSISSDEAKLLLKLTEEQGFPAPLELMQKAKG